MIGYVNRTIHFYRIEVGLHFRQCIHFEKAVDEQLVTGFYHAHLRVKSDFKFKCQCKKEQNLAQVNNYRQSVGRFYFQCSQQTMKRDGNAKPGDIIL